MSNYIFNNLITYLGNKRKLVFEIQAQVNNIKKISNKNQIITADVFSGSGVVARALKEISSKVHSNDLEEYSTVINRAFLHNPTSKELSILLKHINIINSIDLSNLPESGIIRDNYSPVNDKNINKIDRTFYTNRNAKFIDYSIKYISSVENKWVRDMLNSLLLSKASIHVNTSGVFKGFYKDSNTKKGKYGGTAGNALSRIKKDIFLEMPTLSKVNSKYEVHNLDAMKFAKKVKNIDVAYLDPPYNQHPYGSNYFMLNTILNGQIESKISKVSGIPENWKRSNYNVKAKARKEFKALLEALDSKYIIISYNSEGFIKKKEFIEDISSIGELIRTVEIKYNAFRASRNLNSRALHVREYLFVLRK